jgi:hypothetical protein
MVRATKTKEASAGREGNGQLARVDYERLMAVSSANFEALMRASEALMKGVAQLNEELVTFASNQIRENIESGQSLAQCANWSELVDKQASLTRTATEQYLAELGRLATLASETTLAGWGPFQDFVTTTLSGLGEYGRAAK